VETTGLKHDGPMMHKFLNPKFILVADRADFKVERADEFLESKQPFVIRFKTNVELSVEDVSSPLDHRSIFPLDQTTPERSHVIW
jgi:hypothetical protein